MDSWRKRNDVLKEMGLNFRIRLTSQSPYYQIRGIRPFSDGKQIKTSKIRISDPGSLDHVFKLCMELESNPDALNEKLELDKGPAYTPWRALSLELERHLRDMGIQSTHPDYWRHSAELTRFKGNVMPERIQEWVEESAQNSRERTRRLITCNRLIEVGVDIDRNWMDRIKACNKFRPTIAIEPRTLPSDEQVEHFIDGLTNRSYQVVFGYIATWGLRNHEPFRLHSLPDEEGLIEVSDNAKTGFHVVAPAHPEWIERWNLRSFQLPPHDPEQPHIFLGKKVSQHMKRYRHLATWREDAKTYDLRHAYAARIHTHPQYKHIDVALAAEMMGHSEKIHRATYLRWTSKEDLKRRLRQKLGG